VASVESPWKSYDEQQASSSWQFSVALTDAKAKDVAMVDLLIWLNEKIPQCPNLHPSHHLSHHLALHPTSSLKRAPKG